MVKRFDPETGSITPMVSMPQPNEDYCWTPQGTMLALDDRRLLEFDPSGEGSWWQPVATLEARGFGEGGRCAVSPDGHYLAVVGVRR